MSLSYMHLIHASRITQTDTDVSPWELDLDSPYHHKWMHWAQKVRPYGVFYTAFYTVFYTVFYTIR